MVLAGNALVLLVRGNEDTIYINENMGGGIGGWHEVPGGRRTPSGPAVGVLPNGDLLLVVRGTDDSMSTQTRSTHRAWSGWKRGDRAIDMAPALAPLPGAASLVSFARGTDHQLYRATVGSDGSWHAFTPAHGPEAQAHGPAVTLA